MTEELKNPKYYVGIAVGMLLGAAILSMFALAHMRKTGQWGQRSAINSGLVNETVSIKVGSTTVQVAPSYAEALKNPDKPFTDERGVVHPPLGGSGTPVAPADPSKVQAPPAGGTTPTPAPTVKATPAPTPTKTPTPAVPPTN